MNDATYTFDEVAAAGNDPDTAFSESTKFRLGTVPLDPEATASLRSYIEERDYRFAYSILDMIMTIEDEGIEAIPPVLVNTEGSIVDGAHRASAALELGITSLPAYIETIDPRGNN